MVVIRCQRRGTKKVFHHRIVVTEKSRAQSGRVLEVLGYYDPSKQPESFSLKGERFDHWISKGAKVSESLTNLKRRFGSKSVATSKS